MSESSSSCSATSALRGSALATTAIIGSHMRATVCVPTYNERENLEPMLRALGEHGVRVLVIDDNSPDGTGRLADRFAQELDYVDVLHRPRKEGLGPAYIAGFRHALADGAEAGGSRRGDTIVLEAIWKWPSLRLAALRGRI